MNFVAFTVAIHLQSSINFNEVFFPFRFVAFLFLSGIQIHKSLQKKRKEKKRKRMDHVTKDEQVIGTKIRKERKKKEMNERTKR